MNTATPQINPTPHDPREREWQVFRYVAGEMSELEQREFEDLLFEDQTLREAIAEMVCLTQSVSLSLAPETVTRVEVAPVPAAGPVWTRSRRLVWGSVTVAALAVAFFVGWTARPLSHPSEVAQPDQPPESRPVHSDAHVLALVSHWSEGETLVNPEEGELMTESGHLLADAELSLDEISPSDATDADSLNVPEWMLLAVNPAANSAEMEEN